MSKFQNCRPTGLRSTENCGKSKNLFTVKLVYNDPKFVTVADRWSLFRGSFMLLKFELGPQNSGRSRQVVVIWRWSLTQV